MFLRLNSPNTESLSPRPSAPPLPGLQGRWWSQGVRRPPRGSPGAPAVSKACVGTGSRPSAGCRAEHARRGWCTVSLVQ